MPQGLGVLPLSYKTVPKNGTTIYNQSQSFHGSSLQYRWSCVFAMYIPAHIQMIPMSTPERIESQSQMQPINTHLEVSNI